MDWADAVIAAVLLVALFRGWSTGALRQLGRVIGRLVGLALALFYAPSLTRGLHPVALRDGAVIALVVVSAPLGGYALYRVAGVAAEGLSGTVLGVLDRILGVVIGVLGTLVAVWLVVAVASVLSWGVVAQQVNRSWFARTLDRVAPPPPAALGAVESLFSSAHLPSVVNGLILPRLSSVPSLHSLSGSAMGTVSVSASGGCSRSTSGVGLVVGPHLVLTSAHLVAGEPRVRVNDLSATVVGFDSRNDVAVIRVTSTLANSWSLAPSLSLPSPATVVGPPRFAGASRWSAVVSRRVTVSSRGLYAGAATPRDLLLVTTSRSVGPAESGSAVVVASRVVGMVLEPSPAQTGVIFAVPADVLARALATSGAVTVASRCVN